MRAYNGVVIGNLEVGLLVTDEGPIFKVKINCPGMQDLGYEPAQDLDPDDAQILLEFFQKKMALINEPVPVSDPIT